ncbi:MAG: ABC transporter substrate-binding protein, partial [Pirellulales bacterium]
FKIFCSNPSNAENVLDEVIVPVDSPVQVMADLKGKRIGCGPGIQNVTLAKTILERGGATDATVVELPIGQHVAALAAGQIDGAYTLEPTGTIGRLNGTTRVLEAGVIGKYVLGDPLAPWFGGSASLASDFISGQPEAAKKFIAAYGKGVDFVRTKPVEARKFMQGYTAIEGPLTGEVPLAAYTMYNEFSPDDVAHFQKFFDLFSETGVFSSRLMVDSMLYKG